MEAMVECYIGRPQWNTTVLDVFGGQADEGGLAMVNLECELDQTEKS